MEIWDLGSRFGLWHSFVKGKGSLRERERQSRDLKKFYYVFFFFLNIMLTWKSVGASKASVLYVYIDKVLDVSNDKREQNKNDLFFHF